MSLQKYLQSLDIFVFAFDFNPVAAFAVVCFYYQQHLYESAILSFSLERYIQKLEKYVKKISMDNEKHRFRLGKIAG